MSNFLQLLGLQPMPVTLKQKAPPPKLAHSGRCWYRLTELGETESYLSGSVERSPQRLLTGRVGSSTDIMDIVSNEHGRLKTERAIRRMREDGDIERTEKP